MKAASPRRRPARLAVRLRQLQAPAPPARIGQSPQYTEPGIRRTWQRRARAMPGPRLAGDTDVVAKLELLMKRNPGRADVVSGMLTHLLEMADEDDDQ